MLHQQLADGIVQGAVYALLASGYALLFGLLGLLNLAHAAVAMVGALLAWRLMALGLPPPAAALLAALLCGLLGLLLDRVAFAPLRARPGDSTAPLVAGLAAAAIIQGLALGLAGPDARPYPAPSAGLSFGSVLLSEGQLAALLAALALLVALRRLLRASRYGRAARAVAEDRRIAALVGVRVGRTVALTFFLAAALGGAAGLLAGFAGGTTGSGLAMPWQLRGLAIVALGGLGSVPGAALGGVLLGLAEALSAPVLPAPYADAVAFAALIVVLLLLPGGLARRRWAWGAG